MQSNNNSGDTLLRQWTILKYIPQYPREITATQLKRILENEGFDITKRTLERNLISLSEIFPLYVDDRSRPYGWSWSKDAQMMALPTMSPLQALTLSLARDHLKDLLPANLLKTLTPYFEHANNVLTSGESVKTMAQWRNKVANVPANQPLQAPNYSDDVLDVIHEALLTDHQLDIRYASRAKEKPQQYTIHPLGLVQRGSVTYLVATFKDYTDVRMLAVHRIRSAEQLEEKSVKPKGFSLNKYIESGAFGFTAGKEITLVARFTKKAAQHLYETPLSRNQTLKEEGEYTRLQATVTDTSQLRWWLQAFGSDVEVLKPASLRKEFSNQAKKLASLYAK